MCLFYLTTICLAIEKHHYFLLQDQPLKRLPHGSLLIISVQVSYTFSCMLRAKYDRLVEFYLVYLSMSSFAD